MKSILLVLLVGLPFLGFGQVVDTVAVSREVDSLVLLNRKLVGERRFEEALQVIEIAENKAEQAFGKESAEYGNCIHNHGRTYQNSGQMSEAEPQYLEAISIREKVLGSENPDYVNSLFNLANVYSDMSKFELAEPLFLRSISLREKIFGKINSDYANALNSIAVMYSYMGRFEASKSFFIDAKNIREQLYGKEHPDYAQSIDNLGNLYSNLGNYEDAELYYKEAKAIRKKILGESHPIFANSLNNLAILYYQTSRFEDAEALLLEAKTLAEKTYGRNSIEYAGIISNLSTVYKIMGRYESAEQVSLESKGIREKLLGKENADYAASLNNLAILYKVMGRYEIAERFYLEAKNIREKILGKNSPDYAISLVNLGSFYGLMEQYEIAQKLELEAILILEKVFGKEHLLYATNLNNLAISCFLLGDYNSSEKYHLEAISIREKLLQGESSEIVQSQNNLAMLYNAMGRYKESEKLYLNSIDLEEKIMGQGHPDLALILNNLASLYWISDQPETAASLFIKAKQLQYKLLINSGKFLSEKELSSYSGTFLHDSEVLYSFFNYSGGLNYRMLGDCYNNALFYKGFLVEAVSSRNNLILSDSIATGLYNLQKSYLRRLSSEYAKPIVDRRTIQIANWEEKANTLEKELVRTVAGYGDLVRQVSWEEVKGKLPPGSAAIEFISYRYYTPKPTDSVMYAALVLLPTDTTPHFIPIFEERQLQALLNRPGLSEKLILKDLYGNNPELRRLIWDPLEPLLADVKPIYYSPSGLLNRINFGAILDESNQPLSEGRQWVRLGSTRELVTGRLADRSFARSPEENSHSPLTAMVYGGITYDMDSLAFARANPIGAVDSTEIPIRKDGVFSYIISEQPDGSGTRGNLDGTWSALEATSKEADEVSAMLAGAGFSTQKRQGFYASEEQFKQVGVNTPSPRVLHLATHGFSYPDPKKTPPKGFADSEPTYKMLDDPMLRSGLVLAGANYYWKNKRPLANREDGVLVAYEVRDLNLRNTELAVLSACQTGLGDVVGSEGVYGLQRAFRIAGAKFLIVSLWQVPDEQTQKLMRIFYQNWLEKKESLRDAFNHAQQTLREQEPNPFLWAGFVLVE